MTQLPFDQPFYGDVLTDMNRIVVDNIANHPRTLQSTIGPSEMGCERCIFRHFAGAEKLPETQGTTFETVPWLPTVGTAWHAMIEEWLRADNERLLAETGYERWLTENRVPVGVIGGRFIDGSCDLFDLWTASVIDHKLVGATKLKSVRSKKGPGNIYRRQAHVYGRGWKLLGYDVRRVGVRFYPRNDISLAASEFWSEPFDAEFADDVVFQVQTIAEAAASVDLSKINDYLIQLKSDPDCFSCDEYPPLEGDVDQSGLPRSDAFSQPTPVQRRA